MLGTLYHRNFGFPRDAQMPAPGMDLVYSKHAHMRCSQKGINPSLLPRELPAVFEVVELQMLGTLVAGWVVRFSVTPQLDLVLAIRADGVVRTAYINSADGQHATLQQERYAHV